MIKIPIVFEWHVLTPTLFRYLEQEFVDAFFADGSLRLSSFAKFKTHPDEQRLDELEGETFFVHRTSQNGGQTLTAKASHGKNAFALSASTVFDQVLMNKLGYDSCIKINDPSNFGIAISKHIPLFRAGFEGVCLYQAKKVIERDLGYIDVAQFEGSNEQETIRNMSRFINDRMEYYPFYLKPKEFAGQSEYRFIWGVHGPAKSYIDIKVPEARQFCGLVGELEK